jgi:hypothetical protein
LGALMALTSSDVKQVSGWHERDIVAHMFTKTQTGEP